jgi:hypothetical protein
MNDITFGIEVELENLYRPNDIEGWYIEGDGSLRNSGVEFVTEHPMPYSEVDTRLEHLYNELQNHTPETSIRTSVHIHVGVNDLNEYQRDIFLYLWLFAEKAIFSVSGFKRDQCPYCRSLFYTLRDRFYKNDDYRYCNKYSALNLNRFCDLGTFEARTLEGTTDIYRIKAFVNLMKNLKTLASTMTFSDIEEHLNLGGEYLLGMITDNMGDYAPKDCDLEDSITKTLFLLPEEPKEELSKVFEGIPEDVTAPIPPPIAEEDLIEWLIEPDQVGLFE